jgi:hypothetical protein
MIAPTPFFADRGCHTRIFGEIVSLQKMGHEVILCTYGLGREMKGIHTERCFNFPWYKKLSAGPSITKIFLLPFLLFTCMKHIRKFKPTIVHAFLHEGALIARICNLIYKGPSYFFDLQGSLTGELLSHRFFHKNGLLYRIFSFIEHEINSWFPIITQSKNLLSQLISSGVPEDINCDGCLAVGGELFKYCGECNIRECGTARKVENCGACSDYGCEKIKFHTDRSPESKAILDEINRNR